MNHLEYILRILIASVCGFAIGFERKNRAKEAGIRTHFIVAAASALMMIISKYAFNDLADGMGAFIGGVRGADPSRIAAQIVSGVGFLGAGMIFIHNRTISGLTTAAGIWATSGIGMAIGAGMYIEGIFGAVIILFAQIFLRKPVFISGYRVKDVEIITEISDNMQEIVFEKMNSKGIAFNDLSLHKKGEKLVFNMTIELPKNVTEQEFISMFDGDCSVESHS